MLLYCKTKAIIIGKSLFSNGQKGLSMKRLAAFFILICFSATFLSSSMFMLSIEGGEVYTENFSLDHIIKAASSPQDKQSGFDSCRYLCHRHILLKKCFIPEEITVPAGAMIFYAGHDFLKSSLAIASSLASSFSRKLFGYSNRLKLPISPLLQSSVLLI